MTASLLLAPILSYVIVGWKFKSQDITNTINDSAKQLYLARFQKQFISDEKEASNAFFRLYYHRFGRRHFSVPILVIFILIVLEASLAIESIVKMDRHLWDTRLELSATALAALAGAYMWVVSDFTSRARRMDFAPADILWGALRLFIAAPLGLSVSSILNSSVFTFVAFGLGAFPLETIQVFLRQLSSKRLGIELGPTENNELLHLNGIDQSLAERLAHEDITSICQLAYCDPIQMTMRSNLSFNALTDLQSQALAWVYIEDKLNQIRALGLRGSYDIREWIEDLGSNDATTKRNAERITPELAERLNLDQSTMWYVLNQIAYDLYTEFMYAIWRWE